MPTFDSTGKLALASPSFAPAFFIYLDISGDPLRVTNFGSDITFSGTGDSDLDGNTFVAFGGKFLDVGDVSNGESGSDTLTVTLSGILGIDTTLINEIGNKANWQGRTARLWIRLYDETGVTPQGAIAPHYTGYMSSVKVLAQQESQSLQLSVENYLAFSTQASNRSYLNQKDYDSADTSAAATITSANGLRRETGAGGGGRAAQDGGTSRFQRDLIE